MVNSQMYDIMLKTLLAHSVNEISVSEMVRRSEAIILDARAKNEFDVSHIKGAVWVGYDGFSKNRVKDLDKENEVIVYCSVGYRSEIITEKLEKIGFSNVSNLYGGMFEWVNQDNDVVDNDGQITNKVHAFNQEWGIWLSKGEKVFDE